jgi:hypothetical protein
MSLPFWLNSIYLLASILLAYTWTQNPSLNPYNLQLTALFIMAYFAYRFAFRRRSGSLLPSTLILATIILLLVFSTGSINSPLFFLLPFLLFALALFFNPSQAALASFVLLILLFLPLYGKAINTNQVVNLFSLFLTTPIAIIFGRNYLNFQANSGKIALLEHDLEHDETNTLIWLSTKAKPTLLNLLETTSDIIATNKLPFYLQNRLRALHSDLLSLHQSANDLETDIDETDKQSDQQ